jgi:hypothetical protein
MQLNKVIKMIEKIDIWNKIEHIALIAIIINTITQVIWFYRTKDKH